MTKLYTIGEMSQIFKAKTEKIKTDLLVHGFSIDSRTMNAGELFFCIKGEKVFVELKRTQTGKWIAFEHGVLILTLDLGDE